jgi:hypothetical protein
METFQKPNLPHPDSELDVLYMDLDLLDETYPMGKSKLPFEDFGCGGLTGCTVRSNRVIPDLPIWVSTHGNLSIVKMFFY